MKKKLLNIFLFLCSALIAQAERPNVLFISVDDLNDWIGVYGGHPQAKTPHLDAFAEQAMVFRNASCAGPVCGPSRSALLAGFMPSTTGLYGNSHNMLDSEIVQANTTLPEYFTKHGYITMSKGKIFHKHTTVNGLDHGHWAFDIWEKVDGRQKIDPALYFCRDEGIIRGEKIENPKYVKGGGSRLAFGPLLNATEETKDYNTAKWFEAKLQEDYDKPFFMAVGISKPHLPFHAPKEFFDMHPIEDVVVPEFRMDDLNDILNERGDAAFKPHVDFLWCQEYGVMKEAVQAYLATVSYADACVGVVLDALAKSQYADKTIVVIWGDHGWHLGEKLKFRKASLWREATQLPLIIQTPDMQNGQDCTRNVNLIDLYPTLVDLCGLPEKELDGTSIKQLLDNPTLEWRPTVTTQDKGNHSVMSERWHYITYARGFEELYDLENDPMEWTNLVQSNPEMASTVIAELKTYLPRHNAKEIPKSVKDKSMKKMDDTIKARRNLDTLK